MENIGDSEDVTEWALRQTEARRVRDATIVLSIRAASQNRHEAIAALNGLASIYKKNRRGWPNLHDEKGRSIDSRNSNEGVVGTFSNLARLAFAHEKQPLKEIQELANVYFFSIRPATTEPEALSVWHEIAEDYELVE